jgi:aspartate racemase
MTAPTMGILAGMGPRSTAPFLDLVIDTCQAIYGARDDIDFPKIVVCSQPAPFFEDRPPDHAALEAATLDGLRTLEAAGADFLGIACNTVHIYHPRLAAAVSVPLLNLVDLAVADVGAAGGAGALSRRRVALVAARATAESGIYQDALAAAGHSTAEITWQESVDHFLGAVRDTTDPAVFRESWRAIFDGAAGSGADAVLVACFDLSAVVRHAETALPVVDAARSLARALVVEWRRHAHPGAPRHANPS